MDNFSPVMRNSGYGSLDDVDLGAHELGSGSPKQEGYFARILRAFKEGAVQTSQVNGQAPAFEQYVEVDEVTPLALAPRSQPAQANRYTLNSDNLNTDPIYKGKGFVAQRVASVQVVSRAARRLENSSYAGKVFVKVSDFAFNNALGRVGSAALLGLTNGLVRAVPQAISPFKSIKWSEVSGPVGVVSYLALKLMTIVGSIGVLGLDLGLTLTRAVVGIVGTLAIALPAAILTGIVELIVCAVKAMANNKARTAKIFAVLAVVAGLATLAVMAPGAFMITMTVAITLLLLGVTGYKMYKNRAAIGEALAQAGRAFVNFLKSIPGWANKHKVAIAIFVAAIASAPFTFPVSLALAIPLLVTMLILAAVRYQSDDMQDLLKRMARQMGMRDDGTFPAAEVSSDAYIAVPRSLQNGYIASSPGIHTGAANVVSSSSNGDS